MCLFFVHSHAESKTERKEKMEGQVMMRLKSFIDVEIEFKFEWCKGIFSLAYKQKCLFEKSKGTDKFKASETRKSTIKASKTPSGNKSWWCRSMLELF